MTDSFDGNGSGEYNSYSNNNINNNNDDNNDNNYGNKRKIASGGNSGLNTTHNGDNSHHLVGTGNSNIGGPLSMIRDCGNGSGGYALGGGVGGGNTTSGVCSNVSLLNANSGEHGVQLNEKAVEYMRDCFAEKNRMDRKFPIAEKLIDSEIEKVQTTGRIPSREQKYADIYREKPLRISQKVLVPIREHPKFNFVGKLLGPKGNSLRRLQEETFCKMTVLGRNSMRDRAKEEELRASKDPKFAHLNYDLHVEISTVAPPAEAYARIAYAMAELRKYLIPDNNDVIRQEQLRELMDNSGNPSNGIENGNNKTFFKKTNHGAATSGVTMIGPLTTNMAAMNLSNTGGSTSGGILGKTNQHLTGHHGSNSSTGIGNVGGNIYRSNQGNHFNKPGSALAPKQKVLSILEKARTTMDETYGHANNSANHGNQNLTTGFIHGGGSGNARNTYDSNDFDPDGNRRDFYRSSTNYGSGASVGMTSNQNRNHINR